MSESEINNTVDSFIRISDGSLNAIGTTLSSIHSVRTKRKLLEENHKFKNIDSGKAIKALDDIEEYYISLIKEAVKANISFQ